MGMAHFERSVGSVVIVEVDEAVVVVGPLVV